jgi:hypothetical protein
VPDSIWLSKPVSPPEQVLLEADLLTTNVRHFPMLAGLAPAY